MTIPTAYLSLHDVTDMKAAVLQSFDGPLVLTIDSPYGAMLISIYLRNAEADKVELLANNINAAMMLPAAPRATCPVEKAAYAASDEYYARLKADLNRHPIESTDPETIRKVAAAHYLVTGSVKCTT